MTGRAVALAVALLLVVAVALLLALPGRVDRRINRVEPIPGLEPSARALALLAAVRVVDLHADSLIWGRDFLQRLDHGHVDLPRLLDGNVALQVFGVPTQTPLGLNFRRNEADALDMMTPLVLAEGFPPAAWTSRRARALHIAELLRRAAERSQGRLVPVRSAADLRAFLAGRASEPRGTAALLGLEGAQALDDEVAGVDRLFEAGFRLLGLAHFFDNAVAGSSAGVEQYGLTDLGRQVVRRADELGMVIDLAHASSAAIADTLPLVTRPVVASHTGVQATCPGPRNLSDEQVRGIARTGGLVGIACFEGAVCGTTPGHVARAMRHVRDLVGAEHVALGTDFDGGVTTAFDTTGLVLLVDALLAEGFDEEEVRLAMGGNALRVLEQALP